MKRKSRKQRNLQVIKWKNDLRLGKTSFYCLQKISKGLLLPKTELDYLIIGNCILDKNKQDSNLKKDYTKEFELD